MKTYTLSLDKITLIGNSRYFNESNEFYYTNLGFGNYRGFDVKDNMRGYYNTKEEALSVAVREYPKNKPFVTGEIPFEIVFYNRFKKMWCCMTSNTNQNDWELKRGLNRMKQLLSPSDYQVFIS